MTESPASPAHQALASLELVVAELGAVVQTDHDATLDAEQIQQAERSIAMGIAMLVATREEAAAALEASVAGAARRDGPAFARDLLLIADVLHRALDQALATVTEGPPG